ncbi:MAG: hypothetical protein J7J70_00070, partial [Deltaproteobacteria bacterium]|nr:hypothetical protein [Candidatus Tharpellaceae bacterium]
QYESMFAETASIYDAYGYDTMVLIHQVLNALRQDDWAINPETIREKLLSLQNVPLVTGMTSVLPDGEIEKKLFNLSFKRDKIIQVDPVCNLNRD